MTKTDHENALSDVVVIGAGIIGVSAALRLRQRGLSVTIVDREGPAAGASAGNAGAFAFSDILPLASPGIMKKAPRWLLDPTGPLSIPPAYSLRIAPWMVRFWRASSPDRFARAAAAQTALMDLSKAELEPFLDDSGTRSMLRRDGNLEVYESEAEFRRADPGWRLRADHGIVFEHVGRERMDELQPGLSPRFTAGTFTPGWYSIADPELYVLALVERFEQMEGRIVRSIGETIPLETERGYNTTLAADAFDLRTQLTFGGHGFVVSRLSSGIRVGGAVELGGLERPADFRRSQVMLDKAKTFLPALKTGGGKPWMGFRPSLPDSLPVIGRSEASPRILYAFGHGHLGLTQSAGTARLIADLVTGAQPAIAIDPFSSSRF